MTFETPFTSLSYPITEDFARRINTVTNKLFYEYTTEMRVQHYYYYLLMSINSESTTVIISMHVRVLE